LEFWLLFLNMSGTDLIIIAWDSGILPFYPVDIFTLRFRASLHTHVSPILPVFLLLASRYIDPSRARCNTHRAYAPIQSVLIIQTHLLPLHVIASPKDVPARRSAYLCRSGLAQASVTARRRGDLVFFGMGSSLHSSMTNHLMHLY